MSWVFKRMAVYSLLQGEAGLVGAPGKLGLIDSKVEEKPNKYSNKQTNKSFILTICSLNILFTSVHYLHKWHLN